MATDNRPTQDNAKCVARLIQEGLNESARICFRRVGDPLPDSLARGRWREMVCRALGARFIHERRNGVVGLYFAPSPADLDASKESKLDTLHALVGGTYADRVRAALVDYEATGDHDHGRGRIAPGAPCPGGDCVVSKARDLLAKIEAES
jgi:hypothetical protein